jgi:hypothetical protein
MYFSHASIAGAAMRSSSIRLASASATLRFSFGYALALLVARVYTLSR